MKPLAIDKKSLRQCPKCLGWTCLDHRTYKDLVVLACGHQVAARAWDQAPRWRAPDKPAASSPIEDDFPSFDGPEMMPVCEPKAP